MPRVAVRGEDRSVTAVAVKSRDELQDAGWSGRAIAGAVSSGRIERIRPGVYADAAAMRAAFPGERVVARAHAAQRSTKEPLLFSHETAAAIHGLAVYRPSATHVHTISRPERPGALTGVIRHRGTAHDDVVTIDGLRCTGLRQTVADVARTATFEQAVVVADAAVHREFFETPHDDAVAFAADFVASVARIVERSAHGRRRARRVLAFTDGRADLPGESISRIRLSELGFRNVGLQHPVPAPTGSMFYVDFSLDDVNGFGEFDGSIKYVDGRMLDGRTTAEVFDVEKQREDWIRGTTGRLFARWGWPHISSAQQLGRRLSAFGIRPPA